MRLDRDAGGRRWWNPGRNVYNYGDRHVGKRFTQRHGNIDGAVIGWRDSSRISCGESESVGLFDNPRILQNRKLRERCGWIHRTFQAEAFGGNKSLTLEESQEREVVPVDFRAQSHNSERPQI